MCTQNVTLYTLTVNVERHVLVRTFEQRHTGPLANVHGPVHFGSDVDRQLYDGQLAAVEPGLGVAVYSLGDGHALVPPAHFHRRVAGSGLARERGLRSRFQMHGVVLDVQMVGQDCSYKRKKNKNFGRRSTALQRVFVSVNVPVPTSHTVKAGH